MLHELAFDFMMQVIGSQIIQWHTSLPYYGMVHMCAPDQNINIPPFTGYECKIHVSGYVDAGAGLAYNYCSIT